MNEAVDLPKKPKKMPWGMLKWVAMNAKVNEITVRRWLRSGVPEVSHLPKAKIRRLKILLKDYIDTPE